MNIIAENMCLALTAVKAFAVGDRPVLIWFLNDG